MEGRKRIWKRAHYLGLIRICECGKIEERVEFEYEITKPLINEKILWIYKLHLKTPGIGLAVLVLNDEGKTKAMSLCQFWNIFGKIFSVSTIELKKIFTFAE